jgi:hypothetical protein
VIAGQFGYAAVYIFDAASALLGVGLVLVTHTAQS